MIPSKEELDRIHFASALDDSVYYWLCCGSTKYPHGEKTCHEANMEHPEYVRYGTAKEHSEWQLSLLKEES